MCKIVGQSYANNSVLPNKTAKKSASRAYATTSNALLIFGVYLLFLRSLDFQSSLLALDKLKAMLSFMLTSSQPYRSGS